MPVDADVVQHDLLVSQRRADCLAGVGVLGHQQEEAAAARARERRAVYERAQLVEHPRDDLGLGEDALIPVMIYSEDGSAREERARLLCKDAGMDIALLEITSTNARLPQARLASRERLREIEVFEPIYAVGCPLGNDPIPTHGQLSDPHHEVDGTNHWMISAPTYIGNSGGGIFHASSDELIGIFSKIYTHGTLRPTVIPHMGLAVPLDEIYDWLEVEGFASLTPQSTEPIVATASAR